jgi:hypothetical protein
MKNPISLSLALATLLLGAAASVAQQTASTGSHAVYTGLESAKLFYCVVMADSAKGIADRKLQGATALELKRREYPDAEMKEIYNATVDKVYEDTFTSVWDYSVGFFGYCARDIAMVSEAQAVFGAGCYKNSQVAAETVDLRLKGLSKKDVTSHFSSLKSDMPKEVVDKTWAGDQDRSTAALDAWDLCMKPVMRG